eukprot:9753490-Alexandrium_andersonii.AAC.1
MCIRDRLGPALGRLLQRPRPRPRVQRRPPHVVRLVLGLGPGGPAPGMPPVEAQGARLPPGKVPS